MRGFLSRTFPSFIWFRVSLGWVGFGRIGCCYIFGIEEGLRRGVIAGHSGLEVGTY